MFRKIFIGLITFFCILCINGICYACDPLVINVNYHYSPTKSFYIPVGSSSLQINLHVVQGEPVTTWGAPECDTGLTYSTYSADNDDMHINNVSMSSSESLNFSVYAASAYDEVTKTGTVHAVDVGFYNDPSNSYGFDSYTGAAYGYKNKSIKNGTTEHLKSTIDHESFCSHVNYVSSNPGIVEIDPEQPEESPETISIEGKSLGYSWIDAKMGGEDGYDYASVNVRCYDLAFKTVAVRVIHEAGGYASTDPYSALELEAYLMDMYHQGVFYFNVTKLPAMRVNFDSNNDGKLDDSTWVSSEMQTIIDAAKNDDYDYNIFIVNRPLSGITKGYMAGGQKYGFLFPDVATECPMLITAHELGHGAFSLPDVTVDTANIMFQGGDCSRNKFRVFQWDAMHPEEEEE